MTEFSFLGELSQFK